MLTSRSCNLSCLQRLMRSVLASLRTATIPRRTMCTSRRIVGPELSHPVGFTTSVPTMKEQLNGLFAAGGGDGPEAMTAALKAASDLDWRPAAAKMAVLITDAPPHGIGEYGDGFPNGSPDGEDPLVLARSMSARGIALFVVACEPALSGYQHAVDFYHGLVTITSGMLVPLTTASLLSHVVVAAAGEVMDLERLHRELGDSVLDRMRSLSLDMQNAGGADAPAVDATSQLVDQVSVELHEKLLLRNESTKQLIVENIYRESEGRFLTAHRRIRAQHPGVDACAERVCCAAPYTQSRWIASQSQVPGDATCRHDKCLTHAHTVCLNADGHLDTFASRRVAI